MKLKIDALRIYTFLSECLTYLSKVVLDFTIARWLISFG